MPEVASFLLHVLLWFHLARIDITAEGDLEETYVGNCMYATHCLRGHDPRPNHASRTYSNAVFPK
jgi:hypothetical protein